MKSLLFALPIIALASVAQAQVEIEPEYTNRIYDQCQADMGYTGAECACLMEASIARLNETQLEYIWVRSTGDAEGTRRMNRYVGVLQRLDIFLTVRSIARACAPGKPFSLPTDNLTEEERRTIRN